MNRSGGWPREGGQAGDERASPAPFTYESDDFDRAYEPEPGQFDATLTQPAVPLGQAYQALPRESYPWPPAPNPRLAKALRHYMDRTLDADNSAFEWKPRSTRAGFGRASRNATLTCVAPTFSTWSTIRRFPIEASALN